MHGAMEKRFAFLWVLVALAFGGRGVQAVAEVPTVGFPDMPVSEVGGSAIVPKEDFSEGRVSAYVNVGAGFVLSEVRSAMGDLRGNPKRGVEIQGGLDWGSQRGIGLGLFFSAYRSSSYSLELDGVPEVSDYDLHTNLFYVGPELVGKYRFSDSGLLRVGVGVGAFLQREKVKDEPDMEYKDNGWGTHLKLGLEYMAGEHIGIGLDVGYIMGILPEKDFTETLQGNEVLGPFYESEEGGRQGMFRLFVAGGLRFYF